MNLFHAIILGIVQGLTELLPISSSAHLTLIPWAFHWGDIPDSFDVALHFGTLLAIGIFFFKDWVNLLKGGYKKFIKKEDNPEGKMLLYIIIATLPGGIIGVILEKYAQEVLSKPIIIAIALIVMGVVLYIIDKRSRSKIEYKDINLKQGLLIGTSQALAFIPGVSRSGITMTIARALGIKRESAARFSFMLSAPIVLGACLLTFTKFEFSMSAIIGILVSFIVGIVVIKFLLEYLKKGSFKIFAIYRVIIGVIVLICAIVFH